jgi:hypothetical protein
MCIKKERRDNTFGVCCKISLPLYNTGNVRVTFWRVRINIFAMEKKQALHMLSVCSLRYSACNAHAPCHLLPVRVYNIFPLYLINGMIFAKKTVTDYKISFFYFSLHLLFKTFPILRRNGKNMTKRVCCLHAQHQLFLSDFIFFEKYSNIKFYENPFRKGRVVPSARTDGRSERPTKMHDESNSRFSQFFQCAYKGRNMEIDIYIF